jgi:hypothetical protein
MFVLGIALGAAAACGDEGGGSAPPPPPPPGTPSPAATSPVATPNDPNKKTLAPQMRIEDQVACQVPEKPEPGAKSCDPKAARCPDQTFCLPIGGGNYCYPCPERAAIRHEFKDRDFVVQDHNRDPFQSFTVSQGLAKSGPVSISKTPKCLRDDQLVASNYSYSDLRLVGIIAQGTQRKVLMMDTGNFGHIIKRGDCVGKEKAIVKDIGNGYMTFLLEHEETSSSSARSEEHSVQLYPNQIPVAPQPTDQGRQIRSSAPVVAPPALPAKGTAPVPVEQPPSK